MIAEHAANEIKRLSVPKPEDYKAALPADLKLPEGIEYKIDDTNPAFAEARVWAAKNGLSQEEFSQGIGLWAKMDAAKEAAFATRSKEEIAKAGPNATQRVDVVGTFLDAFVGKEDAKPIRATLVTDAHVRFFEKVIAQVTSQGAASFSQAHRDLTPAGKVTEEQWAKMSPAARMDYTNKTDQSQFKAA